MARDTARATSILGNLPWAAGVARAASSSASIITWMNSCTRSRRPASIGSNQSSSRWPAVSASDCKAGEFVLLWSWRGLHRRSNAGIVWVQHPETTPSSIPTTFRTAPRSQSTEARHCSRLAADLRALRYSSSRNCAKNCFYKCNVDRCLGFGSALYEPCRQWSGKLGTKLNVVILFVQCPKFKRFPTLLMRMNSGS